MEADEIVSALLGRGYFPKELPPPFTTRGFADAIPGIWRSWDAHIGGLPAAERRRHPLPSQYVRFDMARKGHSRRMLGIPNPVNQGFLVRGIAELWEGLCTPTEASRISLTPIGIVDGARAVPMPKISTLTEKRIKAYAGSNVVLQTDVLSFYHAIYTHSIPWAVHGKRVSKRNRNPNDPAMFGNRIDGLVRSCQDGQTIGIPVGPDTSRIISEIILCAVEQEIGEDRLGTITSGYRYIDDFFLCFSSNVEAEAFLAALRETVLNYDLQLNAAKTSISHALDFNEPSWPGDISEMRLRAGRREQRRDLIHFFTRVIDIAKGLPDESIASYAVRATSRTLVLRDNWDIYEPFLLRIARENSNCLDSVVKILCTYAAAGYELSGQVATFVEQMIEAHAPYNHHYEICWTLWLCRSLGIRLTERSTVLVSRVENSVCGCLVLMLRARRLLSGRAPISEWMGQIGVDDLKGEHWLLIYEAGVRASWRLPGAREAVEVDPYFRALRDRRIHFVDASATNLPLELPTIDRMIERSLAGRRSAVLPGAILANTRTRAGSRQYDRIGEDYGNDEVDFASILRGGAWDADDEPDDDIPF